MDATKILIIDDDTDVLETARMFLKQEFKDIIMESEPERIPSLLQKHTFDAILLDMNFKRGVNDGHEGLFWLNRILTIDPDAVVILITAYGEVDIAVKAMKQGAIDFVLKPWKNQKLLGTIHAAIQLRKSKRDLQKANAIREKLSEDVDQSFVDFIGESTGIQRVRELIERVAKTDADVLILGENGTGKELVARAIHRMSNRNSNPFISVDLGGITETLFESELFGHVKGAFTDARQDKPGRFEIASGGTLFLDEIGNLSLPLQAKLLTAIQQRKIQRVGSHQEIPIDIRLLCATNMPLYDMITEKKFRQDLLYRINTVEIRVPPLREREEDIPLLADFFLQSFCKKYKKTLLKIEKSVMSKIQKYHWPGNIRELQHAVERAVILNDGDKIQSADVLISGVNRNKNTVLEARTLDEMEKHFILQSLDEQGGNVSQTAKKLGLTRTALYRRMKKHNL